jgi:nitronate monooxygenase
MRELKIGGLSIPVPIIQGGMGVGISLSGLAVAVANQGGVGVISAAGLGLVHKNARLSYAEANVAGLSLEIRKAREMTKGVIGVNIMVAMTNYPDLVKTAIQEEVDMIFCGAGLPLDLPSFLPPGSKTRLIPIVSSARAAKIICNRWKSSYDYLPDAIVVEGPKAGGHLGFKTEQIDNPGYSLEQLITEVVKEVSIFEAENSCEIPVIAAGGIYTGADIMKFMQLGAKGVQLGSRFVTTKECDASDNFKKTYINAVAEDVEVIQSPVGMPGRAIVNTFINNMKEGLRRPVKCPFHCISSCNISTTPYCIIAALFNAYKGNMQAGFAFAGTNAFRATHIITVKELFEELKQGVRDALTEHITLR